MRRFVAHPLIMDRWIKPGVRMAFDLKYQDLGRRIVRSARLAAALDMYEAARGPLAGRYGATESGQDVSPLRHRVVIGGAGPYLVTDDERRRVEPSPGRKG